MIVALQRDTVVSADLAAHMESECPAERILLCPSYDPVKFLSFFSILLCLQEYCLAQQQIATEHMKLHT